MANLKVIVIFVCVFIGVLLLCCLGGAFETLLCTKRSPHPHNHEATPSEADCGSSQRSTGTSPTLRGDTEEQKEEKCLSFDAWKASNDKARYSWQDEQGVTAEVFQDGSLPGAGQPRGVLRVVNADGYQPNEAMTGHGAQPGQEHWGVRSPARGPGIIYSPQFMIGDEQDEEEYEREMARSAEGVASPVNSKPETDEWTDSVHTTPDHTPRMSWTDDGSVYSSDEKAASHPVQNEKAGERCSPEGGPHHGRGAGSSA